MRDGEQQCHSTVWSAAFSLRAGGFVFRTHPRWKGRGKGKNRGFANLIIKILLKAMFFTYLPAALAAGIVQSFHISSPLSVAFAKTMCSI